MSTATKQGCGGDGTGSGGTFEGSADEWEMLRQACEQYVNEVSALTITAKALFNNLDDNFTTNDPYIISLRSSTDYALGHVPTAVNMAAGTLFDNLDDLPTDKQIVVYCYTGQGAGHVSALLNINGYNVISLKYGFCSWTNRTDVGQSCYDPDTAGNYRLIMNSTDPGTWAAGVPAD
jgi:rhodanese-related sulfurtransferase